MALRVGHRVWAGSCGDEDARATGAKPAHAHQGIPEPDTWFSELVDLFLLSTLHGSLRRGGADVCFSDRCGLCGVGKACGLDAA